MKEWERLKEYQEHKALVDRIPEIDIELRAVYQGYLAEERKELLRQRGKKVLRLLEIPRAKELLLFAEKDGLCNGRTWNGTKVALAYFAEKVCLECKIWSKNRKGMIDWKSFEDYFLEDNLKSSKYNGSLKCDTEFTIKYGQEEIDKLFSYQSTI